MKPQDLFIGVRDILALLVPGSVLMLLLPPQILEWVSGRAMIGQPDASMSLVIFFLCAFAAGSALSSISNKADDWVDGYIDRKQSWVGVLLWPRQRKRLIKLRHCRDRAAAIEHRLCPPTDGEQAGHNRWSTKSFWWNYMRLNSAAAAAVLDRVEGLQKQHRSFFLLASLVAVASLFALVTHIADVGPEPAMRMARWIADDGWQAAGQMLAATAMSIVFLNFYAEHRIRFSQRLFELAIITDCSPPAQTTLPLSTG